MFERERNGKCRTFFRVAFHGDRPVVRTGDGRPIAHHRSQRQEHQAGDVGALAADAVTDEVLGVHIIGPMASELIAEAVTIMSFEGTAEDIALICHAHPTLSEALKEAALDVLRRAVHA